MTSLNYYQVVANLPKGKIHNVSPKLSIVPVKILNFDKEKFIGKDSLITSDALALSTQSLGVAGGLLIIKSSNISTMGHFTLGIIGYPKNKGEVIQLRANENIARLYFVDALKSVGLKVGR